MQDVWEVLVLVGVIALLFLIIWPALFHTNRSSRRKSCDSNLTQIVKGCTTYQEPNGDYFPAFMQSCIAGQGNPNIPKFGQGSDGTFQPMPSLAVLYPAYVDNINVFRCPSTSDKPLIAFQYYEGARHNCFGFALPEDDADTANNNTDPAAFTGAELSGNAKCSYFYDELTSFRKIDPGQAIAGDADGQTWRMNLPYPSTGWTRKPRKPNHPNGQNVMFFDGHVKYFADTVYDSHDPNDNIFCPNSTNGIQWDADTDAYLWDGVNSRGVEDH